MPSGANKMNQWQPNHYLNPMEFENLDDDEIQDYERDYDLELKDLLYSYSVANIDEHRNNMINATCQKCNKIISQLEFFQLPNVQGFVCIDCYEKVMNKISLNEIEPPDFTNKKLINI